jgi:hypothetical protein
MISQTIRIEVLWWILTSLLTALVLLPIAVYAKSYPFWIPNVVYIFTFLTFTRFIFLMPYTFFAQLRRFKIILIFLCIPIAFFLIQELNTFQVYVDYNDTERLVGLLPYATMNAMREYVYNEYLLFGVGSIIATIVLPFRLVISIWRVRNTGKA